MVNSINTPAIAGSRNSNANVRITRSNTGIPVPRTRSRLRNNNLTEGRSSEIRNEDKPLLTDSVPDPVPRRQQEQPSSALVNTTHEEVDKVQQICAVENQPLRQEMDQINKKLNAMEADTDADATAEANILNVLRRNQDEHLQTLLEALQPAQNVVALVEEVATLRRDYNTLLEDRSQSRAPLHQPESSGHEVQPMDDTLKQIQQQLSNLGIPSEKVKPNIQGNYNNPQVFPVNQVRQPHIHQPVVQSQSSSDDEQPWPSGHHHQEYDSDDDADANIPFFKPEKGPKHPGLTTIRPSDVLFDRLMNYRYYRLMKRSHRRDANVMLDANKRMNSLSMTLGEHKFSGQDPVLVFDFLTRFTEEADLNRMSEAQAFISLPRYLTGNAEYQYRATRYGSRSGGVTCWPEAIQYFLTTYATPTAIREAVNQTRSLKQHPNEDKTQYSCRLNQAVYRCGNVFEESDKMSFFINGLLPEIQSIVARYREETPRSYLRYDKLVQFARDEGQAQRARATSYRNQSRRLPPNKSVINFVQPQGTSTTPEGNNLLLMQDGQDHYTTPGASDLTDDLPTTLGSSSHTPTGVTDQLLTMDQAKPAYIPHTDRRTNYTRPGWMVKQKIICYQCYVVDKHIAPKCDLTLAQLDQVVRNYESLTTDDKSRVPSSAYKLAKQFISQGNTVEGMNPKATTEEDPKN